MPTSPWGEGPLAAHRTNSVEDYQLRKIGEVQGAQAVDRALSIIRIVAAHEDDGILLASITGESGLTAPTCHRLVHALEGHHFLERDPTSGRYHLGPELFVLGTIASKRFDLRRAAAPSMVRLAQQSEDTVLLTVRRSWQGVCIDREEGSYPVRSQVTAIGDRAPLGVTAAGMAILAAFPDADVSEALAAGANEIAERFPKFSIDLIYKKLAEARSQGYAFNNGLIFAGSWGVAAAINGPLGDCIGAITIAAVPPRLDSARRKEIGKLLRIEVKSIEERLGTPPKHDGRPNSAPRRRNSARRSSS